MTAVIDLGLRWAHALTQRVVTDAVVLHHAAADGSVEAVHSAHLVRGWAGIAYHYYVRKDGSVYRGRPEWAVGGHTSGENWHTLGVCFEGNYQKDTAMPAAQLAAEMQVLQIAVAVRHHLVSRMCRLQREHMTGFLISNHENSS